MKRFLTILTHGIFAVILAMAVPLSGVAQPETYENHTLVSVTVFNRLDVETLKKVSPDIWAEHIVYGQEVLARIPPDRMSQLIASGLSFNTVDANLGESLTTYYPGSEARLERGSGTVYEEYKTFDEMGGVLTDLAAGCPEELLCETLSFGQSIEGDEMNAISIESAEKIDGERPAVVFHALLHAREWVAGAAALCLADNFVTEYESSTALQDLLEQVKVYIVPCTNPDGYQYTWDEARLWRKNRRDNGDGTFGVDLNRNFGFAWGYDDVGSSPLPSSETYRGTAPFSEPEVAALRDFTFDHSEIVAVIDIHAYSQYILMPWLFAEYPVAKDDLEIFQTLGDEMAAIILGVHGEEYQVMHGVEMYPFNGASVDWYYGDEKKLSYLFELRPTQSDSAGFELPEELIAPTCEETTPAFIHLAEWVADNSDFEGDVPDGGVDGGPSDTDADTDSDTDSDSDSDTDTDTGVSADPASEDDGCGCAAAGRPASNRLFQLVELLF